MRQLPSADILRSQDYKVGARMMISLGLGQANQVRHLTRVHRSLSPLLATLGLGRDLF